MNIEPVFYTNTLKQIRLHTISCIGSKGDHLRFICDYIEETEFREPLRAARWLGYAIRLCEEITGLPNEVTRDWVHKDVKETDLEHQTDWH